MKELIEDLNKRIYLLKDTIEAYKRLDEAKDELIESIKRGHDLDIQNNYTKK